MVSPPWPPMKFSMLLSVSVPISAAGRSGSVVMIAPALVRVQIEGVDSPAAPFSWLLPPSPVSVSLPAPVITFSDIGDGAETGGRL